MSDAPTPANLAGRLVTDAQIDMDDVDADIEADVEAALGQLEALPDLAVTDHVAVFEGVQQRLSEILSNVDDANLRLASFAESANLRLGSVAMNADLRLGSVAVNADSWLASVAVSTIYDSAGVAVSASSRPGKRLTPEPGKTATAPCPRATDSTPNSSAARSPAPASTPAS